MGSITKKEMGYTSEQDGRQQNCKIERDNKASCMKRNRKTQDQLERLYVKNPLFEGW